MNLEKLIVTIVASLAQSLAATVIIFKQVSQKAMLKKIIFFILLFLYAIFGCLFVPNQLRFLLFIIIISSILYLALNIKDRKVMLYAFNTEIFFVISEIIISLFLVLGGIDSKEIVNNYTYNLITNVLISLLCIVLINMKFIHRTIQKILSLFDKNKKLIKYFYLLMIILYLISLKNGFEFLMKSNYYINILFLLAVILVLTIIIKNELKYDQINEQNKQMLNYVTKYEKIIAEQGKTNHEFKNQLMVIRGYAQMNSPKLIEYLDSIVDDTKKTHSSYLISQLNKFPDGGVKGLLYYKLSIMEDEKISYEITVEPGVKTKLNKLSIAMYKNITKILGVLLDNAIDSCKQSKNKKILIYVKKENNCVIFEICNTYKSKIRIEKIGTGYTTKGKGHGYGLRLVQDIINSNDIFNVENSLEDCYYVSRLNIKIVKRKNNKKPIII